MRGVCRDGVAKHYPIGQHSLPHEWGKICSILSASFGAADYSPQVAKACTHLCMFPSLLGKVFRSELRKPLHLSATWYTFVPFAHLWAKKHRHLCRWSAHIYAHLAGYCETSTIPNFLGKIIGTCAETVAICGKRGNLIPLVAACCDEIGQTAPCPEVGIPFAVDTA